MHEGDGGAVLCSCPRDFLQMSTSPCKTPLSSPFCSPLFLTPLFTFLFLFCFAVRSPILSVLGCQGIY